MSTLFYFPQTIAACALLSLGLTACKPPTNNGQRGGAAVEREGPMKPIDPPDTEGAIWAISGDPERLLYGKPGETPLASLECEGDDKHRTIRLTRFVATDAEAKALMALIGNGHTARLPVDAKWTGQVWLWEGIYPANTPDLDVLSGPRQVEMTIPGAGSLILNPSERPRQLIDRCRASPNQPPAL